MTEVNAIILRTDGNAEMKYIEADADVYRQIVGGWIEGVSPMVDRGFGNWFAYCNEEGKLDRLPRNFVADAILTDLGWGGAVAGDFIVGDLIIVGASPDGEDVDVPDKVVQHVLAFYREHGAVEDTPPSPGPVWTDSTTDNLNTSGSTGIHESYE